MSDLRPLEKIESWDLVDIRPYGNNVKLHDEEQIAKIAASIKEFGFDQPIVVDGAGVIIKGHGRFAAARLLGMKKLPIVVRTDLTAAQANASRLADNRVAQSDVDTELLHRELVAIAESGEIDMDSMGFSDKELEFMIEDLGEMNEKELIEDLEKEMDAATNQTNADVAEQREEGASVSLAKIFGYSSLPGDVARKLTRFLRHIEAETDLEGADAVGDWLDEFLTNGINQE